MEISSENQFTNDIESPKRNQFLTAICILSWLCCAYIVITGVAGIFTNTPEKQAEQIEQMRRFNPEAADKMETILAEQGSTGQIVNNAIGLIGMGLSALGVWFMWNLQKKGFYFYLLGELIPYVGIALAGKTMMATFSAFGGSGNLMAVIMIALMVVFDAAFIIMYAVNLKHMKSE
ncbi:MAG: hypothetical protein IPM51_15860 [Sphingobacteriaceae bacterium]|nr:hypothetical protein [Sphingobacteriaceae bacterium]